MKRRGFIGGMIAAAVGLFAGKATANGNQFGDASFIQNGNEIIKRWRTTQQKAHAFIRQSREMVSSKSITSVLGFRAKIVETNANRQLDDSWILSVTYKLTGN